MIPRYGLFFYRFFLAGIFTLCFFSFARADADSLKKHLLIVYNKTYSGSETLAHYYAAQRGIPLEKCIGLACQSTEEIDRATFEQQIRDPLKKILETHGWLQTDRSPEKKEKITSAFKNDIWAIVLIRGIPLKISNDSTRLDPVRAPNVTFTTNAAAVDSELATLPLENARINSYLDNPYFYPGYCREFDEIDAKHLILVTRLDGPSEADVKRMIDESIAAEKARLTGLVCLDSQGKTDIHDHYEIGDEWLRGAKKSFIEKGFAVAFDDRPELFADNLPWSNIAFYAGWYSDPARGFFFKPPRRFVPGAIAYHIQSYSAATLRNLNEHWTAPLINAGADAVIGPVYEPYLYLMNHVDIFAAALLQGHTFAEAAYLSQPALSWMNTVVGDPLYTPFALSLPQAIALAKRNQSPQLDELLLQSIRLDHEKDQTPPSLKDLRATLLRPEATAVAWESLGDLVEAWTLDPSHKESLNDWQKAFEMSQDELSQIRLGKKMATLNEQIKQPKAAQEILALLLKRYPANARFYGISLDANGHFSSAEVVSAPAPVSSSIDPGSLPQPPKPPEPPEMRH